MAHKEKHVKELANVIMPITESIKVSLEASLLAREYKFNQNGYSDSLPTLHEGPFVGENTAREWLHIPDNHPRRATMNKLRRELDAV